MNRRLKQIGTACKQRRKKLGLTQYAVAVETGYSIKTISAFETGRTNNAILLVWYMNHGLDINEIFTKGGVIYG